MLSLQRALCNNANGGDMCSTLRAKRDPRGWGLQQQGVDGANNTGMRMTHNYFRIGVRADLSHGWIFVIIF